MPSSPFLFLLLCNSTPEALQLFQPSTLHSDDIWRFFIRVSAFRNFRKTEAMVVVDPHFKNAGKKAGLEIWRIKVRAMFERYVNELGISWIVVN